MWRLSRREVLQPQCASRGADFFIWEDSQLEAQEGPAASRALDWADLIG